MSKVLVVVGMHRSGTSLITHWLNRCGLFVGNMLAGPEIGNAEGLFEDMDFQQMHKQLLKKRNCSPIGFVYAPVLPPDESEKKQLRNLIEARERTHDEWGWKDPITCLFLDVYRELIPSAFYVIIVRDYHATVSSLVTREHKVDMKRFHSKKGIHRLKWRLFKRKKINRPFELYTEKFLKVWIHYYEEIFNDVQLLPANHYVFVNHSQLLKNDLAFFNHLKDDWKFSLNYFPFSSVYKMKMISEVAPIEKYIHNKELLIKAKKIEEKFRAVLSETFVKLEE